MDSKGGGYAAFELHINFMWENLTEYCYYLSSFYVVVSFIDPKAPYKGGK